MENKSLNTIGSWAKIIFGWTKKLTKGLLLLVLGYTAVVLAGLIPVNNDFQPEPNGVTIFVVSNAVHADIIVPKSNSIADWNAVFQRFQFAGSIADESHVAFGWGDRGFFLETETWDDLKLSTAANALLLPSQACQHVTFTRPEYFPNATSVNISYQQYQRLVDFINDSFELNEKGQITQIQGYAYAETDGFFDARGRYHLLNTCNSWVGRALRKAGVKAPWLSPLPQTPTLYIPN